MRKKKFWFLILTLGLIVISFILALFISSCSSMQQNKNEFVTKIQNDIENLSILYYDKNSKKIYNDVEKILKQYKFEKYEIIKINKEFDQDGNIDLFFKIKINNNEYEFIKNNIGWCIQDIQNLFSYNIKNKTIELLSFTNTTIKTIKLPSIVYDNEQKYYLSITNNTFSNCLLEKLDLSNIKEINLFNVRINNLIIKNNYLINSLKINKCFINNFIILDVIANLSYFLISDNEIQNIYLNADNKISFIWELKSKCNEICFNKTKQIKIVLFNNDVYKNIKYDYCINDDKTISIKKISGQIYEYNIPSYLKVNNEYLKIKEIGPYAFENLETLVVLLNDKSISLNEYCFSNNIYIQKIILPEELDALPKGLFKNCISLININYLPNVVECKESLFENCYSLLTFIFSDKIKYCNKTSFKNCFSVVEYNVPYNIFCEKNLLNKLTKINIRFRMTLDQFKINFKSAKCYFAQNCVIIDFNNFCWSNKCIIVPSFIQVNNNIFYVHTLLLNNNTTKETFFEYFIFPTFFQIIDNKDTIFLKKITIKNFFACNDFFNKYQHYIFFESIFIENLLLKSTYRIDNYFKETSCCFKFMNSEIENIFLSNKYINNDYLNEFKSISNKSINIHLYFVDNNFNLIEQFFKKKIKYNVFLYFRNGILNTQRKEIINFFLKNKEILNCSNIKISN